jgi:hypothetical protein
LDTKDGVPVPPREQPFYFIFLPFFVKHLKESGIELHMVGSIICPSTNQLSGKGKHELENFKD